MKIIDFKAKYKEPVILALGFFDCVHKGHQELINVTEAQAGLQNCKSAVFTFSNNPSDFYERKFKLIYSYEKRLEKLESLGVDIVISCEFNENIKNLSSGEFLRQLFERFNVKGVICGNDFTFGKGAEGDVSVLQNFCARGNISVHIVKQVYHNYQKLSSSLIREFLQKGEIENANYCLGEEYSISGKIVKGSQDGREIGFPTININVNDNLLRSGVYKCGVLLDNNMYNGIANLGAAPTFLKLEKKLEVFLFDFNKNVYGKTAAVFFRKFVRDIIHFPGKEELMNQIKEDIRNCQ